MEDDREGFFSSSSRRPHPSHLCRRAALVAGCVGDALRVDLMWLELEAVRSMPRLANLQQILRPRSRGTQKKKRSLFQSCHSKPFSFLENIPVHRMFSAQGPVNLLMKASDPSKVSAVHPTSPPLLFVVLFRCPFGWLTSPGEVNNGRKIADMIVGKW